jgi:hypothetical protein
VDEGVMDVGKERNEFFKVEETGFPTSDGSIIVILLVKTDDVFCTSPIKIYILTINVYRF